MKRSELLVRVSQVVSEANVFGRRIQPSPLLPEKIQPHGWYCHIESSTYAIDASKLQICIGIAVDRSIGAEETFAKNTLTLEALILLQTYGRQHEIRQKKEICHASLK